MKGSANPFEKSAATWASAFIAAAILALVPRGAGAASTLHFTASPLSGGRAAVLADGRVVLRLAAEAGWKAFRRARAVAAVLDALSDDARFRPSFEARTVGGLVTVWGGGKKVVTVTPLDAKAAGLPPPKLASLWIESLKRAFSLPHLAVSPERLTVAVGEWAKVWIRAVPPKVEASIEPPEVAALSLAPGGGAASVVAKSPGKGRLVCRNPAGELIVPIEAKYRAAYLKEPPRATVTSPDPSDEVLRWAAFNAIYRAVALREEAKGSVSKVEVLRTGRPGALASFVATGPGYLDWRRELLVVPAVIPMGLPEPELLLVSNWPERVTSPGTLLLQPLEKGKAVRVLYHHLNAAGRTLDFSVALLNFDDKVAEAQVVPACPEPEYSPLSVGHAAVVRYFRRRLGRDSFVAEVGPKEKSRVVSHTVRPGEVVSGILEVNLLSDVEAALAVEAAKPGRPYVEPVGDLDGPSDHAPYVYPEPIKVIRAKASVGERWLYLDIGSEPVKSATSEHVLLGNYGVVYRFEITVENPKRATAKVPLLFHPRGGPAAGTFVIEGKLKHFGATPPGKMKQIASVRVPGGSSRLIEVLTMPEPGSYYPASLVIKTTGVLVD